ncbi:ABC transporter ATP-binding protein [Bradyrhizobium jicamae]|uniref:ABC transporter ATP-binding protein n=1 Tax=Bradyrhizobium jicamae TaxID=280332 RepID=UPI001BAE129D|nr:ABC transporter ATP-binding protein [Bradyrhizobium jicamae]MBR0754328.1 ABC transporter ATP-binding protein [Bradyrhizobium jicamae]
MTAAALETRMLCKQFGALQVTNGVSLRLKAGGRQALIGPNGAGKSTLINLLTGVLAPSSGSILLEGAPIDRLTTDQRVTRGLGRTFQVNALFPYLTPLESIMLAVARRNGRLGKPLLALHRQSDTTDEAFALARSVGLERDCLRPTAELPYGRQRLLEIALALAGQPRVLLLDEPAAGVPAGESFELMQAIEALPRDVAILFIEHDMDLVFRFAETITVLVAGTVLCEGTPGEIARDPEVRRVYLGNDGD